MIRHHPDPELLLALAAGNLDAARAVLVAVHLEGCPRCREHVRTLRSIGGLLLDEALPAPLAPGALPAALTAAVFEPQDAAVHDVHPAGEAGGPGAADAARAAVRPALPPGVAWPEALRGCAVSRWRWVWPGVRWSRITSPVPAEGMMLLLRVSAGGVLPRHAHRGSEMTQVLCGSFEDGRQRFGAGDFHEPRPPVDHRPTAVGDIDCVCLVHLGDRRSVDPDLAETLRALLGDGA